MYKCCLEICNIWKVVVTDGCVSHIRTYSRSGPCFAVTYSVVSAPNWYFEEHRLDPHLRLRNFIFGVNYYFNMRLLLHLLVYYEIPVMACLNTIEQNHFLWQRDSRSLNYCSLVRAMLADRTQKVSKVQYSFRYLINLSEIGRYRIANILQVTAARNSFQLSFWQHYSSLSVFSLTSTGSLPEQQLAIKPIPF